VPDGTHGNESRRTAVILYDGVCGLCNRWVQFVLRRDRKAVFLFAALQSPVAREILIRHAISPDPLDTIYVVRDFGRATERALSRSSAALYIFSRLGGMWRLAALLRALPQRVRDFLYHSVARHRYLIFGKYNSCLLPETAYRDRFIELRDLACSSEGEYAQPLGRNCGKS
jgi:predicted DCC family thiol-disulfide oxidoreductase YuxK